MLSKSWLLGSWLVVLPCLLVAAEPQDPDATLGDLVTRALTSSADAPVEELWRRASELSDAARELSSEGLDSALDRALAKPDELGESARLLASAARLAGSEPDVEALANALEPLFTSTRDEYATAALGLVADVQFRSLSAERRAAVLKTLRGIAEAAQRAPIVRLEAANALFQLGFGDERRAARDVMSAFLASGEAELRAQGALALARTGAEIAGPLLDELRRLALIPDERGRLAQSYIEVEDVKREANRKLKRVQELRQGQEGGAPASGASPGDLEQVARVITMVERFHLEGDKVKRSDLVDSAVDGMLRSLDEHSSYMPSTAYGRFEQELEAGYGGIGAYVSEDPDDRLFTITHPIYSGPAYKAGLLSDDKIVRIDDWPTLGQPVDEIIKRLKGRPGTSAKLYVWRRGMDPGLIDRPSEDMVVEVQRAVITIPAVTHELLPGKVGLVHLREFSRVAAEDMRAPLQEMLDQGMRAVVLDLRGDSGGLLDQAVAVAGLFLPRGSLVVTTESRVAEDEVLRTEAPPLIPPEMPVVVLINRFSASAAEIVSGALQDHHRATLVGQRSFGKGSVQNLLRVMGQADDDFDDENQNGRFDNWERITKDYNGNGEFDFAPRVKMTIARYRLPSGRSIHREIDPQGNEIARGGVDPDLVVNARRMDTWRYEELYKLQKARLARDYVDRLEHENAERSEWLRERMFEIAQNDRKDISLYPGFEEFYQSLTTPLSRDDVRELVRAEIRRRVQDARGQEFPPGDFVEDLQLQEAIKVALEKLGESPANYSDYAAIPAESVDRDRLAAMGQDSLSEALRLVETARSAGGQLSDEELKRLEALLRQKRTDGN
jgi:carboxyl-terminal processing protease